MAVLLPVSDGCSDAKGREALVSTVFHGDVLNIKQNKGLLSKCLLYFLRASDVVYLAEQIIVISFVEGYLLLGHLFSVL